MTIVLCKQKESENSARTPTSRGATRRAKEQQARGDRLQRDLLHVPRQTDSLRDLLIKHLILRDLTKIGKQARSPEQSTQGLRENLDTQSELDLRTTAVPRESPGAALSSTRTTLTLSEWVSRR